MSILHIPLHPDLRSRAVARKAGRSWETYVNELIRFDVTTSDAPPVPPPQAGALRHALEPVPVEAALARRVAPAAAEPTISTPLITRTADEILRDEGHPDYQNGIKLFASAILEGAAIVMAQVE